MHTDNVWKKKKNVQEPPGAQKPSGEFDRQFRNSLKDLPANIQMIIQFVMA